MKLLATFVVAAILASVASVFAAESVPATAPATQAATPACCGDTCKKMGGNCCKADDKGKITCAMGGSCCLKPSTAPVSSMPAMGGMRGMRLRD